MIQEKKSPEASIDATRKMLADSDWKAEPPREVEDLLRFSDLLSLYCNLTMDGKSEAIKIKDQLKKMRIHKEIPEGELTSLFSKLLHMQHAQVPKTIEARMTHLSAKIEADPRAMARTIGIVAGIKDELPKALLKDLLHPDLKRPISQALQPSASRFGFFAPKHESTPLGKFEKPIQEGLKVLEDAARQASPLVVDKTFKEGHYLRKSLTLKG